MDVDRNVYDSNPQNELYSNGLVNGSGTITETIKKMQTSEQKLEKRKRSSSIDDDDDTKSAMKLEVHPEKSSISAVEQELQNSNAAHEELLHKEVDCRHYLVDIMTTENLKLKAKVNAAAAEVEKYYNIVKNIENKLHAEHEEIMHQTMEIYEAHIQKLRLEIRDLQQQLVQQQKLNEIRPNSIPQRLGSSIGVMATRSRGRRGRRRGRGRGRGRGSQVAGRSAIRSRRILGQEPGGLSDSEESEASNEMKTSEAELDSKLNDSANSDELESETAEALETKEDYENGESNSDTVNGNLDELNGNSEKVHSSPTLKHNNLKLENSSISGKSPVLLYQNANVSDASQNEIISSNNSEFSSTTDDVSKAPSLNS